MAKTIAQKMEDRSMAILTETLQDVRSSGLPSLAQATDDDLRVALYIVFLKVLDMVRGADAGGDGRERDVRALFLEHTKELMDFIDGQSSYTVGHTQAVARHVNHLASRLDLDDSRVEEMEYAAWIHNIGLINQSHKLSTLPRALSEDEMKAARNHAVVGAEIIRPIEFLSHLVPTVLYHHHRFDGGQSGGGPRGHDLPLGSRIISLADAYQAMREPRAYRPALSRRQALDEIIKGSGAQFDPDLVPLVHELV
jgi:HD-GYP domain-containing protein (c-di-GMP phosphodiesterase class II)